MIHIKGERFGFPLITRAGVIRTLGTYPVNWDRHDGFEIHYVLKGQTAWELAEADSPLVMTGGSFAIIPPGVRHRALGETGSPAVRVGFLLSDHMEDHLARTPFSVEDVASISETLRSHGGTAHRMSSSLLSAARRFADSLELAALTTTSGRLHLRVLTAALIDETVRSLSEEPSLPQGEDLIAKVCQWIDTHSAEDLNVERIIRLSGYGRSRFFALFLRETGMTPRDYITRIRIERAKRLIASRPELKMSDIARECGFSSPTVFATIFHRHVGSSPREFAAGAPTFPRA